MASKSVACQPSRLLKNTVGSCYKDWVFESKEAEKQEEFWIERRRLPKLSAGGFFRRVEEVLAEMGFGEEVHRLCRPIAKEVMAVLG